MNYVMDLNPAPWKGATLMADQGKGYESVKGGIVSQDLPIGYPWDDPAGWRRYMNRNRPEKDFVHVLIQAREWSQLPALFAHMQEKIKQGQLNPLPPEDEISAYSPRLLLRVEIGGVEVLAVPLTFAPKEGRAG